MSVVMCLRSIPAINKKYFWDVLNDIGEAYHGPWCVIRDFNAIISASEKKRGLHLSSSNKGRIDKVIEHFSLIDLGFGGNNSCGITNIQERLDCDIVHATAGVSYFLKLHC